MAPKIKYTPPATKIPNFGRDAPRRVSGHEVETPHPERADRDVRSLRIAASSFQRRIQPRTSSTEDMGT